MFEQCIITGKHVEAISVILASPAPNVVGSGCGCILWSHIQFFHRPMFSFWTRQLSRAERGGLRYVHAGLIDQKGIFLTCQNERTNERMNEVTTYETQVEPRR